MTAKRLRCVRKHTDARRGFGEHTRMKDAIHTAAAPSEAATAIPPIRRKRDRFMTRGMRLVAAMLVVGAVMNGAAIGADGSDRGGHDQGDHRAQLRYDQRYEHNRYYARRGTTFPALPGGSTGVTLDGENYFYHDGVWFRRLDGRYVVIEPPIGIVAPILPPVYVSLSIGGAAYYYANEVFYARAPGQGYGVVPPPPGAEAAQPTPPMTSVTAPPPSIIYPRDGQNAEQTESDQRECGRWTRAQPNATADATVYLRALAACMDGRGYTVR